MACVSFETSERIEATNLNPKNPLKTHTKDGITRTKVLLGKTCAICLKDSAPGDKLYLCYVCRKTFHKECIYEWLAQDVKDSCPCCRVTLQLPAGVEKRVTREEEEGELEMAVGFFWISYTADDPQLIAFLNHLSLDHGVDLAAVHVRIVGTDELMGLLDMLNREPTGGRSTYYLQQNQLRVVSDGQQQNNTR